MVTQVLSRTQRRMERRQALLLLALVLAVSLVSFALGVMVGRGKGEPSAPSAAMQARLPVTSPAAAGESQTTPDLTFYDSLPKGGKAPLGSGINLPTAETAPPRSGDRALQPTAPEASSVPRTPALRPALMDAATGPAEPAPSNMPAKAAAGTWTIQAGSFQEVADAKRLEQRLAAKGLAVSVQQITLAAKGIWYRVIVGPFPSEGEATGVADRLRQEEKLSVLIRKS